MTKGSLIQDLADTGLVSVTDGWVMTTAKSKAAMRTLKAALEETPERQIGWTVH